VIPVLGVPCLNQPDMLDRMIESVDVKLGRLVIVDNGGVVAPGPGFHVIQPGHNLGVGASWNLIIQANPAAPWWFITNDDIEFAPGDLARLAQAMDAASGPLVALLGTFSAFGINRGAVRQAGWFDENFAPAYFEDNDFDYRCHLTGVEMIGLPAGLKHKISSTLIGGRLHGRNNITFPRNHEYYVRKWGGPPRGERFKTPFDAGGDPRSWVLEIDRLVEQTWT